jgi:Leucine-rich repeat (LRR) protein
MSGIKNNPKGDMRILKLSNNELSITAAIRLAHVLKNRISTLPPVNLQVLSMRNNAIGNIGCETLIGFLKKNQTLKYLDISFNQIGDRGLLAVAECLRDNQ